MEQSSGRSGLARLLDDAVTLLDLHDDRTGQQSRDGLAFYNKYNDSRLALAFGGFDAPMRNAIFELIFLLNCNDPKLAQWQYIVRGVKSGQSKSELVGKPRTVDLYVEGAPAGLTAIRSLSPRLRADYERYVRDTFRMEPYGEGGENAEYPIVALQAVGSTGTIGQKPGESDLDLQVIYETSPFAFDSSQWSDKVLVQALNQEYKLWLQIVSRKRQMTAAKLQDPETKKAIQDEATQHLKASYPYVYRALTDKEHHFSEQLVRTGDKAVRARVLREIFELMKRAAKLEGGTRTTARESLFKRRIQAVQDYITAKFPEAEVYLFVYTTQHFRSGTYDSTLEFKESSGSAYEYILNYETLMPGIQLTPLVPAHFLLTEKLNKDAAAYDAALDCLRFGALPAFDVPAGQVVDLGPTTALDTTYIARHGGAIYWEAFKASSGNLAKAMLNLLRFETLLDPRFLRPIMHMIKDPGELDQLCAAKPGDEKLIFRYEVQLGQNKIGLAGWGVLDIERRFPALVQDPWWLRYKALKIAFESENGIPGIDTAERSRLSSAIDLCFCMHLRISDVLRFAQEGQKPSSFREQVLSALLDAAFPAESPRRIHLDNLLSGDARGLISFEKEMRDLFQRSMTRVEQKMAKLNIREHVGKKEELDLWLNYYLENFQPQPNLVPRMIMKHLKKARIGIDVSYRPGEGWVFMSIQHLITSGLPRRRSLAERYLPDRLILFETPSFLTGLAHCIVNGYYGPYKDDSGAPKHTVLEMEAPRVKQEKANDNELAVLNVGNLENLFKRIAAFFPYRYVDYKAMLQTERKLTEVFICLNAFHFGRLSIVYRNNVNAWFCEDTDLQELIDKIETYSADADVLIGADAIHARIAGFIRQHQIDPAQVPVGAWVNPHSFKSGLGADYHGLQRDFEEGRGFREMILHRLAGSPRKLAASG